MSPKPKVNSKRHGFILDDAIESGLWQTEFHSKVLDYCNRQKEVCEFSLKDMSLLTFEMVSWMVCLCRWLQGNGKSALFNVPQNDLNHLNKVFGGILNLSLNGVS